MSFIEINTEQAGKDIAHKLKPLYGRDAAVIINRAINHTLQKANSEANRQIRSVYNIPLKYLNDKEGKLIKKSNPESLTGTIEASTKPLSLSIFNPVWVRDNARGATASKMKSFLVKTNKNKSTKVSRGKVGVTVEIIKGKKETINSAFMLFKTGGTPVMARGRYSGSDGFLFGRSRLPIGKLNTKSIFYSLINEDVQKNLSNYISKEYPDRIEKELNYFLNIESSK
jgi:hypothetical protein